VAAWLRARAKRKWRPNSRIAGAPALHVRGAGVRRGAAAPVRSFFAHTSWQQHVNQSLLRRHRYAGWLVLSSLGFLVPAYLAYQAELVWLGAMDAAVSIVSCNYWRR
jgi:hypothetical protein